jgi:hypothetical protein
VRQLRTAVALLGATLAALAGAALPTTASAAGTADPTAPAPKKLFSIKDDRIKESSGLVKSVKHQDLYWTVNDSGDSGRIYGVDLTGKVKAVLRFGAKVKDVEALGIDRDGTLYVADIGDNKANRDQVEIYTIPEPETLEADSNVKYHQYDFQYPDGAHDAETLLIEPGTSQLYIVTKALKGAGTIYAAPPAPSRQGTNDLSKLAPAPEGVITDGTFLPDGQHVVLRTYTDAATVAWGDTPTVAARGPVPLGQGETVALGRTDNTVVVGSEGANSGIYQIQVPAKTTAGKTPTANASPKASTAPDSNSSDSGKSHNLRWIIIGAALFALLITVFTFPPGRRERRDRQAENARLTGQDTQPPRRRQHS